MKALHMVAFVLLVIGGLNWGLSALGYNVIEKILGSMPAIIKIVYVLVGLSAVLEAATHTKNCKHCETKMSQPAV